MWAVAAQPRVGLTPMIPTPSFDSPDVTSNLLRAVRQPATSRAGVPSEETLPPGGPLRGNIPSRRQNQHWFDSASFCCVLCRNVDLIERVSANESVERQP